MEWNLVKHRDNFTFLLSMASFLLYLLQIQTQLINNRYYTAYSQMGYY